MRRYPPTMLSHNSWWCHSLPHSPTSPSLLGPRPLTWAHTAVQHAAIPTHHAVAQQLVVPFSATLTDFAFFARDETIDMGAHRGATCGDTHPPCCRTTAGGAILCHTHRLRLLCSGRDH